MYHPFPPTLNTAQRGQILRIIRKVCPAHVSSAENTADVQARKVEPHVTARTFGSSLRLRLEFSHPPNKSLDRLRPQRTQTLRAFLWNRGRERNNFLSFFVFLLLLFFFLLDCLFTNSEDGDAFISHTLSPLSVPLSSLLSGGAMVSRTSIALVTSFTWKSF